MLADRSAGTSRSARCLVFAVDVMTCSRCGGRMKLLKVANEHDDIARALAELGLGPRPPPRPKPALPGQLEFDFAA